MKNKEIREAFDASATHYERVAKIQGEIGQRLIERLDYFKIQPQRILDLGCGPGVFSLDLAKRFPKAQVFSIDLSMQMSRACKKKRSWRHKWFVSCADMAQLPFGRGSFDLIFSNQVIHWAPSGPSLFAEVKRVLAPNGVFLFSSLGPDTFVEIKQAWANSPYSHVNEFVDMHNLGDELLAKQFIDPVMDMERIQVNYKSLAALLAALKAQGVKNIHAKKNKGLTGKKAWQQFKSLYPLTDEARYPLSYEVLYGQAWGSDSQSTPNGTQTFVPISNISKHHKAPGSS